MCEDAYVPRWAIDPGVERQRLIVQQRKARTRRILALKHTMTWRELAAEMRISVTRVQQLARAK